MLNSPIKANLDNNYKSLGMKFCNLSGSVLINTIFFTEFDLIFQSRFLIFSKIEITY
ncbi:hypothetical protein L21SP5_03711 [Salinivirga cyanobacteriivorans]|uniref:Uncharacterized protein n=1 Tax=Salinivirga cyanobacteriivorans TaxID=1307839 RepID=A0A0S2I540_9BACT|nr:hypothetical protein L21SP5_03711 [Salinivirga cyanobacteriivorans]